MTGPGAGPSIDPTRGVDEWLTVLSEEIRLADPPVPALAEATGAPAFPADSVSFVARFLSSGWTLHRLDAVLVRAREYTDIDSPRARSEWYYDELFNRLVSFAHLSPDEFDAWSALYGHDVRLLTTGPALQALAVWRARLPLPLAAACVTAGLTPIEATSLNQTGGLNTEALAALAALRRPTPDHRLAP